MSAEYNLRLVQRMYDALNRQDLDAHDEYWHEDMIWHGPPGFGSIHGLDGFKNDVLKPFYEAFPDYHAKNDIEFAGRNLGSSDRVLNRNAERAIFGLSAVRPKNADAFLGFLAGKGWKAQSKLGHDRPCRRVSPAWLRHDGIAPEARSFPLN